MSFVRILTIFASLVVLAVMLVLVYNGAASSGFSEIITLFLVLGLTGLLGVFTYDPRVMWHHCVRFGLKDKERRDGFSRRIVAQLALYALISGIIIAIVQILSVSGHAGEMEKKLALWSLLYGVFSAVGLWVISGVDKPSPGSGTGKTMGDENQVILAFCVLLLTVGVLALLFMEFQKVVQPGFLTETSETVAQLNSGLPLGEDLVWRPATLVQEESLPNPLPERPLRVALGAGAKVQGDLSRIMAKPTEAPLRWELNLKSPSAYRTD
jgi:hypothetical protein